MVSYSTNANVQNLVYGATNTDLDIICSNARDVATSIINSALGLIEDTPIPSNDVIRCCTLLAAGIISSSPDKLNENEYWKQGKMLLEKIKNIDTSLTKVYKNIPVERF